ncbi:MAG: DUF1566 domain-containing protein [Spirochaetaceae bacterium]|jgi:hypothetical protein|nr:DUF1566 domain-containing protein [Spirochaetaceae bacterium]
MKKSFVCFMSAVIVGAALFAQQPSIVKAPPMAMINPLTQDEANSVEAASDKMLGEAKNVRILNRLVIEKAIRDYGFQPRDWADVEKTIALGEVLDAGWIVRPQVQRRVSVNDSGIVVTAALLNVQTHEITYATPVLLGNVNETQKIEPLIAEITRIVTGGTGGLAQSDQTSAAYKVGDYGPSGGWVFYVKRSYSDGWRYLEAAPRWTETTVPRGNDNISGLGKVIGTGKRNTGTILQSKEDFPIIKAAKMCAGREVNWFKDWFLPSYSELWEIRTNPNNFAGFNTGYYWSSTGSQNSVGFSPGNKSPDRNQPDYFVRAVRAF